MEHQSRFLGLAKGVSMLAGTTIGAGILGIPYVISQSGYWIGMLHVVVLGVSLVFLNLCLTEVTLRTDGEQQLPGLARKYLGRSGKLLTFVAMAVLVYGSLTAYIAGSGDILAQLTGIDALPMAFVFFGLASLLVFLGVKAVSQFQLVFVVGLIVIMASIALRALTADGVFDWNNMNLGNSLTSPSALLPYGAVLFSYLGVIAIPDIEKVMKYHKRDMDLAVVLGFLIPVIIYIVFSTVVIGVTGPETTGVATIGLGQILGGEVFVVANIFGLLAMFTSFLALGLALVTIYREEYDVRQSTAVIMTVLPPMTLVFAGISGFADIISFTGAVSGSIIGIVIVFMYWKSKYEGDKIPEFSLGQMRWGGVALVTLMLFGLLSVLLS